MIRFSLVRIKENLLRYMGGKSKIAKYILPIILQGRGRNEVYVEPFVGGANMIDKVNGERIGADVSEYVIALFEGLQEGKQLPLNIDKDFNNKVKDNQDSIDKFIVGDRCN